MVQIGDQFKIDGLVWQVKKVEERVRLAAFGVELPAGTYAHLKCTDKKVWPTSKVVYIEDLKDCQL